MPSEFLSGNQMRGDAGRDADGLPGQNRGVFGSFVGRSFSFVDTVLHCAVALFIKTAQGASSTVNVRR